MLLSKVPCGGPIGLGVVGLGRWGSVCVAKDGLDPQSLRATITGVQNGLP